MAMGTPYQFLPKDHHCLIHHKVGRYWLLLVIGRYLFHCQVPDDQIALRSYPLLAARELLHQIIQEHIHEHQVT